VTDVGPQNVVDVAHKLGIQSKLDPNCSIALGAVNVNPLEMTSDYATFAARGMHHGPTPLVSVKGPDGIRAGARRRAGRTRAPGRR
jgi:penicillin-binding protein 1A